jgi:hypothetical protein
LPKPAIAGNTKLFHISGGSWDFLIVGLGVVADIEGGTQAEGVGEYGGEENICA